MSETRWRAFTNDECGIHITEGEGSREVILCEQVLSGEVSDQIAAAVNACAGLPLPPSVPVGALARVVEAVREGIRHATEDAMDAGPPLANDILWADLLRIRAALAELAADAGSKP